MRRGEERRMLEAIADLGDRLINAWETQFIESLLDQLDRGGELTNKQREKLVEVYERRVLGY